jgi:hypothetical protein
VRNRHLYPKEWEIISLRCRELAGWKCQHCGVERGAKRISRKGRLYSVALQACHKDHKQRHCPEAELLCLCFTCHWWYDFSLWLREQSIELERLKHAQRLALAREFERI